MEKTSDEIHELTLAGWEIQDVSITPIATLTVDVNRGVIDVVSEFWSQERRPVSRKQSSSATATSLKKESVMLPTGSPERKSHNWRRNTNVYPDLDHLNPFKQDAIATGTQADETEINSRLVVCSLC